MKPDAEGGLHLESPDEIYYTFQAADNFEFDLAPDVVPGNVAELKKLLADHSGQELFIPQRYFNAAMVALELYTGGLYKYRYETGTMLNDYERKKLKSLWGQ